MWTEEAEEDGRYLMNKKHYCEKTGVDIEITLL